VLVLNACSLDDLASATRLILVTSTWGEGDPPDNAAEFWTRLNADTAPHLEHLQFSVLALGDRNYSDFCGAGRKFDERLEALGARRIHPRADCDTDYEEIAATWMKSLWTALQSTSPSNDADHNPAPSGQSHSGSVSGSHSTQPAAALATATQTVVSAAAITTVEPAAVPRPFNRNHPFPAQLIANRLLNGPGSAKDTRHLEIALLDSGLNYEAGDALGVLPTNCPALVEELLTALRCDGEEAVLDPQGTEVSFRHALRAGYHITQPSPALVKAIAERAADDTLASLLAPERKAALTEYLSGHEIIDLLIQFASARFTPAEFIALLRKLQPRLYSISSSPKAHPGEVHLTVAVVRYDTHGRRRKGVCSTFLADRVELNTTPVPVFVQHSHGFRLPADPALPIVMVGPGTGIAPFRAFIEERRATGATGMNWLFFGDQHHASDFLYRDELEAWKTEGALTRLDLAFSRDQTEKLYVQHRLIEHAADVWNWLEAGAHFYVCGDAKRMAKDVDAALHAIVQQEGGKSTEETAAYVAELKNQKRYQRDVY
jgi:sulfite reductase (NADPH) flavoprotein alpha-component